MMLARLVPLVLAAVPPAAATSSQGSRLPLPPPRAALEFEPGTTDVSLDELLVELAQLTGQELAMAPQTLQVLQQSKERLERADPVPEDEVYAFVEGLLARQGVILAPITGGSRPILGVQSSEGGRPGTLDPLYVDVGMLAELERHPALLVRLLLQFENLDSRQMQTQLRQLTVDNTGTNQCVPVGEAGLILQGRGRDVAGLARMVLEADKAAAGRPRPVPVPEKAQEGPR